MRNDLHNIIWVILGILIISSTYQRRSNNNGLLLSIYYMRLWQAVFTVSKLHNNPLRQYS